MQISITRRDFSSAKRFSNTTTNIHVELSNNTAPTKTRVENWHKLTHLLFWYHVFTCMSERCSFSANCIRSCTERYFCLSKVRSSSLSWWSEKAVLAFLTFLLFPTPLSSWQLPLPAPVIAVGVGTALPKSWRPTPPVCRTARSSGLRRPLNGSPGFRRPGIGWKRLASQPKYKSN